MSVRHEILAITISAKKKDIEFDSPFTSQAIVFNVAVWSHT
jgi:hypothetical protein